MLGLLCRATWHSGNRLERDGFGYAKRTKFFPSSCLAGFRIQLFDIHTSKLGTYGFSRVLFCLTIAASLFQSLPFQLDSGKCLVCFPCVSRGEGRGKRRKLGDKPFEACEGHRQGTGKNEWNVTCSPRSSAWLRHALATWWFKKPTS